MLEMFQPLIGCMPSLKMISAVDLPSRLAVSTKVETGGVLSIRIPVERYFFSFTKPDLSSTIPSGMMIIKGPSPVIFVKENSYIFSVVFSEMREKLLNLGVIELLPTVILRLSDDRLFLIMFFSVILI